MLALGSRGLLDGRATRWLEKVFANIEAPTENTARTLSVFAQPRTYTRQNPRMYRSTPETSAQDHLYHRPE